MVCFFLGNGHWNEEKVYYLMIAILSIPLKVIERMMRCIRQMTTKVISLKSADNLGINLERRGDGSLSSSKKVVSLWKGLWQIKLPPKGQDM